MSLGDRLRAPSPLRLSTVRDCPRRAVLEAIGAPQRDLTEKERRVLFRGKEIGRAYATMLAAGAQQAGGKWRIYVESGPKDAWPARYLTEDPREAAFIAEQRVPWAHGIGHADLVHVETRTVIEVLSSADPSDAMRQSKLVQAVLYAEHMPNIQGVCLRVVNPSDFSDEQIVQLKGSPEYDASLAVARERLAAVDRWASDGVVPDCTGEANAWFCRLDDCLCKQPGPPLDQVDTPEAREAALAFAQAKQNESAAKVLYDQAKAVREDVQGRLADVVPVAVKGRPTKVAVGPFEIARSHIVKESFKLTLAKNDSRLPADLLAEFTSVSEYDTFRIQRVSDDPALTADGFGDEVPWTDADLVTP